MFQGMGYNYRRFIKLFWGQFSLVTLNDLTVKWFEARTKRKYHNKNFQITARHGIVSLSNCDFIYERAPCSYTERFTDLGKLKLQMVVWF